MVGLLSEMSTGGEGLWGAGVRELMSQAAAKSARFGKDFFAGLFMKSEHQFLVFQGAKAGHIVLIIDEDNRSCWAEQFQGAGTYLWVEFLAIAAQQEPLQETVGEQYEDNLVDDKVKATGGECFQVGEALQLAMTLFNGSAQGVVLAATLGISNRCGGKQHPVILAATGIDLFVDDDIQGYRTGGKGLDSCNDRDFGTNQRLRRRFCICIGLCLTQGEGPLPSLLAFSDTLGGCSGAGFGRGGGGTHVVKAKAPAFANPTTS